ncbi:Aminoglycoside phosphotransferase [Planctomycetales bacterium 10988]|nr:Aminoglycoside phosphotransferase [Planctomycetales bacterium 10988]
MLELTLDNVESYLRDQGKLPDGKPVEISRLPGGVSNEVFLFHFPEQTEKNFVLKQAREQLRTPTPWFADLDRIWQEVEVLHICHELLTPQSEDDPVRVAHTPAVLFEDREQYAFAMEAAPPGHTVWKSDLLAGKISTENAEYCGSLMGRLHAKSWHQTELADRLGKYAHFEDLRLDPYYRTLGENVPSLKAACEDLIEENLTEKHCFVHADFSPKNILCHEKCLILIDFETGHHGDPAFDLGFFLTHLMLKAFYHAPDSRQMLLLTLYFWEHYLEEVQQALTEEEIDQLMVRAIKNFAGCFLSRMDAKSRIDYLTRPEMRHAVRGLGHSLLLNPVNDWTDVIYQTDEWLNIV